MRSPLFGLVPLALLLTVSPVQGQVMVGIHLDIPIIGYGRDADDRRGSAREIRIYDSPPMAYGQWNRHSRDWRRVVVYVVHGRYYAGPVRGGRTVSVYRDRDRYFWGPRDGDWSRWDRDGRDDRYNTRDRDDGDRNGRDDRVERDDRYDGRARQRY
jgi:hypothetical protein